MSICDWFKREPELEEPEPTIQEQLKTARAHLARVKKLPISAFTPRIHGGYITTHSIDRKDEAIQYAEAEVAELEILAEAPPKRESE
jgi:hypothetical protein